MWLNKWDSKALTEENSVDSWNITWVLWTRAYFWWFYGLFEPYCINLTIHCLHENVYLVFHWINVWLNMTWNREEFIFIFWTECQCVFWIDEVKLEMTAWFLTPSSSLSSLLLHLSSLDKSTFRTLQVRFHPYWLTVCEEKVSFCKGLCVHV